MDNALAEIGIDTADPEAFQYVPGIGKLSRWHNKLSDLNRIAEWRIIAAEPGLPLMPTEGIHCALYQLRGHLYTFFELQVLGFAVGGFGSSWI